MAKIRKRKFSGDALAAATLPVFMLEHEAAELLRVKVSTLQNWRSIGCSPPYSKVGVRVLYDREALIAWVRERTRTTTTDETAA